MGALPGVKSFIGDDRAQIRRHFSPSATPISRPLRPRGPGPAPDTNAPDLADLGGTTELGRLKPAAPSRRSVDDHAPRWDVPPLHRSLCASDNAVTLSQELFT
jgi:hypothetical protein